MWGRKRAFNMTDTPETAARKDLPLAAIRALEEAEARRRAEKDAARPNEQGGPKGPEPTRYGDWERSGRAVDF